MGVLAQEQVDKKCYKNQTAGWIGVVKLDHLGQQVGESVEPFGTVYLSDDEALLTARAPKDPARNPFVPKTYAFIDNDTGQVIDKDIRALVLISDERDLPVGGEQGERYVPGLHEPAGPAGNIVHGDQQAGRLRDAQAALEGESDREGPSTEQATDLPGPQRAGVHPGTLRGGAAVEVPDEDEAATGGETGAPPQQPAPQTPGSQAGAEGAPGEETAAQLASGEETGAAATPSGQAPEGEFASHEEVGSPEAPQS